MSPFCHSNLYGIASHVVMSACCSPYVPLLLSAARYCVNGRLHSATLVQAQADKAKVFFGGAMKAGVAAGVAAMKWRMNMPGADEQRVRCSLRWCKCTGVQGGVLAICLAGSHPCSFQQISFKRVLESSWDTLGADFCSLVSGRFIEACPDSSLRGHELQHARCNFFESMTFPTPASQERRFDSTTPESLSKRLEALPCRQEGIACTYP
jgi:hypothetical protein